MKIVINPQYASLEPFIRSIPSGDYAADEVYRNKRNTVHRVTVEGVPLVIKRYRKPNPINRFVYVNLRRSKARRSYEDAARLLAMDVGTARPVAYIEQRQGVMLHSAWFVSEWLPYSLLGSLSEEDIDQVREVLTDFARFTYGLHARGICHHDYNENNIFYYRKQPGEPYSFAIVDINRLVFRKKLTRGRCVKEFHRLDLPLPALTYVGERYALLREWNAELFCGALLAGKALNPYWKIKKALKKTVRFLIPSKKQ